MKIVDKREVAKVFKKLSSKVIQYIYKVNLLEDGDHIMVGLSGGKDSYLLLEILAECKRRLPFEIKVSAVHIMLENVGYEVDTSYMSDLCRELNIPLYIITRQIDLNENGRKGICFICSWTRRKLIFNLIHEKLCSKLAFGHHMDDAVQTMLMNQIWHGTFSSMPCSLPMLDSQINLVRPLLCLTEEDVISYIALRDYPAPVRVCPHDDMTKRQEVRTILEQIKLLNKAALKNMFRSMENIFPEYLPRSGKELKKRNCKNLVAERDEKAKK